LQVKCIGRRRIDVIRIDNNIGLKITVDGKDVATPVLEKDEAIKLVGELNGIIRFDTQ
jgi:hypothetical protein